MKWLGQHIVDLISRFRSDVYLDSPTAGGSDPDKFLGIDSNNKIIYRTGTQVLSDIGGGDGDITGVTAGVGLSGGGTSDAVTLTLDLSELSDIDPVNGDKLATLDSDGSTEQLTTIASLADLFAGTGLTAASSVIGVDAAQTQITSVGTIGTGTWEGTTIAVDQGGTGNTTGVQAGKDYRIVNTSFRDDIGTDLHYLPLKDIAEQTVLTREEVWELAVCDGRLVSATVRVENLNTHSGDATLTIGVVTNVINATYASGTVIETESLTVNNADDHHVFHFVFDTAKHWDSTDMFAISIQSDTDITGSLERFFITLVIEDDWSTYLAGSSREIDSTP